MRVYKFYSSRWALDALKNRRLKIATLDDLNDPFEFIEASSTDRKQRQAWQNAALKTFDKKGLISFSRSWENPVLWSHYGERHFGAALGFDVDDKWLRKVRYREKRTVIPDLTNLSETRAIELFKSTIATKFSHWSYENEYRIFVTLDEQSDGLYFKDFDEGIVLREVILGPRSQLTSKAIFDADGSLELEVVTTRLAFQSYSVVRQRASNLQK